MCELLPHPSENEPLFVPQFAVPAAMPGPVFGRHEYAAERHSPLGPTFRMNAYGLYDSTVPTGHIRSVVPIAGANASNPCMSCDEIGRGAFVFVRLLK